MTTPMPARSVGVLGSGGWSSDKPFARWTPVQRLGLIASSRCDTGLAAAVPGPAGNLRRGPTAASTPTLSSPPVVRWMSGCTKACGTFEAIPAGLRSGVGSRSLSPAGRPVPNWDGARLVENFVLGLNTCPAASELAGGTGDGAGRRGSVWASRSFGDGSSPWPGGSPARHAASPCICHSAGLGKPSSVAPWHGCERFHSQPDGARPQLTRHPPNRTSPQTRASPVREHLSPRPLPAISPYPTSPDGHKVSPRRLKTDTGPIYPNRARTIASLCPSSPILLLQRHTFGGFGLKRTLVLRRQRGSKRRS